jgi:hypothetical protein
MKTKEYVIEWHMKGYKGTTEQTFVKATSLDKAIKKFKRENKKLEPVVENARVSPREYESIWG